MKVSDFTWREPVTIDAGDTIATAAALVRRRRCRLTCRGRR